MKVVVYTTSWCPHCEAVRKLLKQHRIEFIEHDVEKDDEKWHEAMKKAGGRDIVPVVDIDGKIFFGAYEDIEEDLKAAIKKHLNQTKR